MHRPPKGYFSHERKIPGAGGKLCLLLAHATRVNPAILQANGGRAASRMAEIISCHLLDCTGTQLLREVSI